MAATISGNQPQPPVFSRADRRQTSRISAEYEVSMAEDSMEKQQKQRGRPFVKGQSGNPAGRPRGSRNRGTQGMQWLLDDEAQALTRKAVELALEGDTTSLALVPRAPHAAAPRPRNAAVDPA